MSTSDRVLSLNPHRHIPALDGLRGLAIFATIGIHAIFLHAIPDPPPAYLSLPHVMVLGWMGVDLFFVLSGFLITGILLDTQDSHNYFRSFYVRRTLRIFPAYYAVLLVCFFLSPWIAHTAFASLLPEIHNRWWVLLTYTQNWLPSLHSGQGQFGPYWSLAVEEQFYLIWPLLVFFLSRRNFLRLCFALCVLCPLLRIFLLHPDPYTEFAYTWTFARMDTLIFGALAAVLVRSTSAFTRIRPWLPWLLIGSLCVVFVIEFPLHELYHRGFWMQFVGYTFIGLACSILLLFAFISDTRQGRFAAFLKLPLLRTLGRYSYGMYLFQIFPIIAVNMYLKPQPWYGKSLLSGLAVCAALFLCTFAMAWLSYHLFEAHFLRLKSHFAPDRSKLPARPLAAAR